MVALVMTNVKSEKMRIVNVMFAKTGGGIEQAFVDYCEGLRDRGHEVTAITAPNAWAIAQLRERGINTKTLWNINEYDVIASFRLGRVIKSLNADVVIAHANRAFGLTRRAIKNHVPLVGVVQNYSTRRYGAADAVFTTTNDLISTLEKQGIPAGDIYHIPNMVECRELPHRPTRRNPPVIGTLGRFVAKKGFDIYIEALALLKARGLPFTAVLGGNGEEEKALRDLAKAKGLDKHLEFLGWIGDRKSFYNSIDIFCLPSHHEPFGIVLLEAFANGVPVVSGASEGPKEIITPNYDALIVEKGDAALLADALAKFLNDAPLAERMAANGYVKAKTRYSLEVVAEKIEVALVKIIAK